MYLLDVSQLHFCWQRGWGIGWFWRLLNGNWNRDDRAKTTKIEDKIYVLWRTTMDKNTGQGWHLCLLMDVKRMKLVTMIDGRQRGWRWLMTIMSPDRWTTSVYGWIIVGNNKNECDHLLMDVWQRGWRSLLIRLLSRWWSSDVWLTTRMKMTMITLDQASTPIALDYTV